jgi:YbbR domain-containing protein
MLARFLNNWPYKLLSLAIAIVLRVYVGDSTNPQTTKQINVPIVVTGVPTGLVATQWTPNVAVTFTGPPNKIEGLSPSDVQATVNLSRAHDGPNAALPITITLPAVLRDEVQSDNLTPSGAAVYLDTKISTSMTVTPEFSRSAPVGYQYLAPTDSPAMAKIEGPSSLVNSVSRLVIFADPVDALATPTTIDETGPIVAMDDRDAKIEGLEIVPSQAHVIIPIRKVGALKSLVVSPEVIGSPRYPFRITAVTVNPTMVVVSGPVALLAQTSVALTTPINVSGQSGEIKKTVKLDLPSGLTAVQNPQVDVSIEISVAPPADDTPNGLISHEIHQGAVQ